MSIENQWRRNELPTVFAPERNSRHDEMNGGKEREHWYLEKQLPQLFQWSVKHGEKRVASLGTHPFLPRFSTSTVRLSVPEWRLVRVRRYFEYSHKYATPMQPRGGTEWPVICSVLSEPWGSVPITFLSL